MELDPTAAPEREPDAWWQIFDPRRSLRARAVLVLGGGAVAFAMLVPWAAGTLFRRQLEHTLGPSFENLAYQVGDKLDRGLYERQRALEFTASLAPFRTVGTPAAQLRLALDGLLNSSPDFVWVGYADADGAIVSAAPRLLEGTEAGTWFRSARRQSYLGSPHEFPELAREFLATGDDPNPRFLDLAVPVTDPNGKFLGVLGAHVRWCWARDTQSTVISETARRDHLGVTIYAADGEVLLDSHATGWTEPPPAPPVGNRPGLRGSLTEDAKGDTTYLTGYARSRGFRTYRGLGWLVTVRQPVADAFAPVQELRRQLAKLGAALSGAAIVLIWLAAWYFTRRANAIAKAAGCVASGDVLALLPLPQGRDEFQKMCAALGVMVEKLRERRDPPAEDPSRRTSGQNRHPW